MLNPVETPLQKWLPALSESSRLIFREGVEVEWTHVWPTRKLAGAKVIYFIRDPRDALFSRYRRESPDASFGEFLHFPDAKTQLDKIETWNLFNEVWLSQPNLGVFRFEDYKRDASVTLRAALRFAGIAASDSAVDDAVAKSRFEQAAAAEKRYREKYGDDTPVINRASLVGSWKDPGVAGEAADIARRCGHVMARLGYVSGPEARSGACSYLPHSGLLRFYRNLDVPAEFWNRPNDGRELSRVTESVARAMTMSPEDMEKYRLQPYERWQLLTGLQELASALGRRLGRQLRITRAAQSAVPSLVWRINELLSDRGIRLPRPLKVGVWKLARLGRAMAIREFR
jgi:hypothetical protein